MSTTLSEPDIAYAYVLMTTWYRLFNKLRYVSVSPVWIVFSAFVTISCIMYVMCQFLSIFQRSLVGDFIMRIRAYLFSAGFYLLIPVAMVSRIPDILIYSAVPELRLLQIVSLLKQAPRIYRKFYRQVEEVSEETEVSLRNLMMFSIVFAGFLYSPLLYEFSVRFFA